MKPDEFAKIKALEDSHWWYHGRRYLLRQLVNRLRLRDALILDAGCGTGYAGSELSSNGIVVGLDAAPEAFEHGRVGANCVASIDAVPFTDGSFDLVVSLDMIEHLDDDAAALQEIHRICRSGGFAFITVPAYQWLWSNHDDVLGHKRRYTARELAARLMRAGFTIQTSSYFVSLLFPAALAYRLVGRLLGRSSSGTDLAPVPSALNALLGVIMKLESVLVWRHGLPFGLTAFVLARKADGASRR